MHASTASAANLDPAPSPTPQLLNFEFRGTGGEYFRIWIVNLLLTLVTLGIYGPWAKVRRLRYFYGNTVLAGSSFEYHGEPLKILKGRLLAVLLIAPYYIFRNSLPVVSLVFAILFLIALPFIIVQSRRFQMRMSSWRNVHFGFLGTYGVAARIYLGLSLLIPFTLGLLLPYVQWRKQGFILGHTRFGGTQFEFDAQVGPYYRAYLVAGGWLLLSLVAGGLCLAGLAMGLAAAFGASLTGLFSDPTEILRSPGTAMALAIFFVALYGIVIAVMMVPGAIVTARLTNEAFSHTRIGPHQLQSTLRAGKLVGIYLSNLLLVLITLGLYIPWAKVKLVRYQLDNTALLAAGDIGEFAEQESHAPGATGEELGDFLDVDFGL